MNSITRKFRRLHWNGMIKFRDKLTNNLFDIKSSFSDYLAVNIYFRIRNGVIDETIKAKVKQQNKKQNTE
jgi:hypothetical protein